MLGHFKQKPTTNKKKKKLLVVTKTEFRNTLIDFTNTDSD
jgi:hypothetical protein